MTDRQTDTTLFIVLDGSRRCVATCRSILDRCKLLVLLSSHESSFDLVSGSEGEGQALVFVWVVGDNMCSCVLCVRVSNVLCLVSAVHKFGFVPPTWVLISP